MSLKCVLLWICSRFSWLWSSSIQYRQCCPVVQNRKPPTITHTHTRSVRSAALSFRSVQDTPSQTNSR